MALATGDQAGALAKRILDVFFDLLDGGHVAGGWGGFEVRPSDAEDVEGDAVGAGENVGTKDVEPGGDERPGDALEQSRAVPSTHPDFGVALVGLGNPAEGGRCGE